MIVNYDGDEDEAEVTTGVIYGPRHGGGHSFRIKKIDGHWQITERGGWVS